MLEYKIMTREALLLVRDINSGRIARFALFIMYLSNDKNKSKLPYSAISIVGASIFVNTVNQIRGKLTTAV